MIRPFALITLGALACGGGENAKPAAPSPSAETERYFKAVDARFDGDSRAYYDELLALAHDQPDSRAGRKARAVLQSDSGLWMLASAGAIASSAIPNFTRYQAKAKESEARTVLESVYLAQSIFMADKLRYCRTFEECDLDIMPMQYALVMGPKESLMPPTAARPTASPEMRTALAAAGVKPRVEKKRFVIAAIANLDDDPTFDIWTIDEQGNSVHVVSDLE